MSEPLDVLWTKSNFPSAYSRSFFSRQPFGGLPISLHFCMMLRRPCSRETAIAASSLVYKRIFLAATDDSDQGHFYFARLSIRLTLSYLDDRQFPPNGPSVGYDPRKPRISSPF
jgi:hypothetical protein